MYFSLQEKLFLNRTERLSNVSEMEGKKGVLFDCSNGRPHWTFDTLRNAKRNDFYPDIISSDVIRFSQFLSPGFSLLHAMAVCSAAGWDTLEILKRVTYNPARYLQILDEAGTCLLYTSPSPRDATLSRMPSSA